MNLKQFRYMMTLVNEGSFSKAADKLNIRQPSLSQYIRKIEQEVGYELFDRAGGNVRLTDAGRAYLEIGRQMLDLAHQLESRLCDISAYREGTVTVGISAHRSVALMPEIVKEFHKVYPGIVLHLEERKRHEILDAAEHGEFDLCLTTLPVDEKVFTVTTAMTEENVLAVPDAVELPSEQIPGRKFPAVSASLLNGMDFAVLNEEHPMQVELDRFCAAHGLNLHRTVQCTSLETLVEMVGAGVGAAYIPSCLAKPRLSVRYYSVTEETARREIVLIHRKEQYLSEAIRSLENIILTTLKTY